MIIRLFLLLYGLFAVGVSLRCQCTTDTKDIRCYNTWCDVHNRDGRVGACAVIRSGAKQHFACVRVSKDSSDSECRVDRTNGKLLVRCWCKSGDYCNVDLSERVEDPEAALNGRNSIDEDEDYVLPTTEGVKIEETYDLNDANYPISEEDFDDNPLLPNFPPKVRIQNPNQNLAHRPPPTTTSNVTTIPPWRREEPIRYQGSSERRLPPALPSPPPPLSNPRNAQNLRQSQNPQQYQSSSRQGYAPPPARIPYPVQPPASTPSTTSTTTNRPVVSQSPHQKVYEEMLREHRRRAEQQRLEMYHRLQVDSRRSFADASRNTETAIVRQPAARQNTSSLAIKPPLVGPPQSTPSPQRPTTTINYQQPRTYRPYDLNSVNSNRRNEEEKKPFAVSSFNASIVRPPVPQTNLSYTKITTTRKTTTTTTTSRPTTTTTTTTSRPSSTKPSVIIEPIDTVDVSEENYKQYDGEDIYQVEEVVSEAPTTTTTTSRKPPISKEKVKKYKELIGKKDNPDAAYSLQIFTSVLLAILTAYII